ncbi:MAG: transcription antitermination factor NusB [Planctomycetota bacterium]
MRRRTRAREIAVQFMYQVDVRGEEAMELLDDFLEHESPDAEVQQFALRLILGTRRHADEIDTTLRAVTRNWDLERMAIVDRNVLRVAIFELLMCPDIPPKVTINEAIELGKRFSTANSGAFINGILDRVRLDHGGGTLPPREPPAAEEGAT